MIKKLRVSISTTHRGELSISANGENDGYVEANLLMSDVSISDAVCEHIKRWIQQRRVGIYYRIDLQCGIRVTESIATIDDAYREGFYEFIKADENLRERVESFLKDYVVGKCGYTTPIYNHTVYKYGYLSTDLVSAGQIEPILRTHPRNVILIDITYE